MKLSPKKKQVIRGKGGECGRTRRKLVPTTKTEQVIRGEDEAFRRQSEEIPVTPIQVRHPVITSIKTGVRAKKSR